MPRDKAIEIAYAIALTQAQSQQHARVERARRSATRRGENRGARRTSLEGTIGFHQDRAKYHFQRKFSSQ